MLHIDDNPSNLRLVERILAQRPGVKLIAANQGARGLELARQHSPDLILLDLHLPDLPGDEILRQLRADPHTAQIPVVVISADATAAQIAHLRAAGASDYLTKPINVRQFLARVDATPPRPTGAVRYRAKANTRSRVSRLTYSDRRPAYGRDCASAPGRLVDFQAAANVSLPFRHCCTMSARWLIR